MASVGILRRLDHPKMETGDFLLEIPSLQALENFRINARGRRGGFRLFLVGHSLAPRMGRQDHPTRICVGDGAVNA